MNDSKKILASIFLSLFLLSSLPLAAAFEEPPKNYADMPSDAKWQLNSYISENKGYLALWDYETGEIRMLHGFGGSALVSIGEEGELPASFYFETNAFRVDAWHDEGGPRLFLKLYGRQPGENGFLDLWWTEHYVLQAVYLDNQPVDYVFESAFEEGYQFRPPHPFLKYHLRAENFTFSSRMFVLVFLPRPWYEELSNVFIAAVAIVIVIGAIYWFRFRKKPVKPSKSFISSPTSLS